MKTPKDEIPPWSEAEIHRSWPKKGDLEVGEEGIVVGTDTDGDSYLWIPKRQFMGYVPKSCLKAKQRLRKERRLDVVAQMVARLHILTRVRLKKEAEGGVLSLLKMMAKK